MNRSGSAISSLVRASLFNAGLILYEGNGVRLSKAAEALKQAWGLSLLSALKVALQEREIALAGGKGLLVVSLGQRILRAETAAISAVALVQFLLGDIG